MSDASDDSVVEDVVVVGEESGGTNVGASSSSVGPKSKKDGVRKDSKGHHHHLHHPGSLLTSAKKEKKDKKDKKEKETRYAHLGDETSGEDEADGKSPAKTKRSKPFIFGSAKKDKRKAAAAEKESKARVWDDGGNISVPAGAAQSNNKLVVGIVSGEQQGDGKSNEETSKEHQNHLVLHKKEKKEKGEKEKKEKANASSKLKLKKSKHLEPEYDKDNPVEWPVFGVDLELAVERDRCHDGIPLPLVVRRCIDYIEEHGLGVEGVYRSSGVKSKVNKLRAAFNARSEAIVLTDYEPAVVASVLKQFLRELPDPVLTHALTKDFESVSSEPDPQRRIEGMKILVGRLPVCNRTLLQWMFVHMKHVIERQKFNKMTLQNFSIVLSPTMRISHRVLNCIYENTHILFDGVRLKKYVPPITAAEWNAGVLPDRPDAIQAEISKQESLLADLHLLISSGAASKKTEEQIWEQQRIVTQLKRKLRTANKVSGGSIENTLVDDYPVNASKYEPIDYEEELNFSLQVLTTGVETTEKHEIATCTGAGGDVPTENVVATAIADNEDLITKPRELSTSKKDDIHEESIVDSEAVDERQHRVTLTIQEDSSGGTHAEEQKEQVSFVTSCGKSSGDQFSPPLNVRPQQQNTISYPQPVSRPNNVQGEQQHHVTVIRLGSSDDPPPQPTSVTGNVETSELLTKRPTPHTSAVGVIPLLLPPPPPRNRENKNRQQQQQFTQMPQQILKPEQAAPIQALKAPSNRQQPPPVLPSVSIAKSKSRSLPRGLPTHMPPVTSKVMGSGPQSLNPFPAQVSITEKTPDDDSMKDNDRSMIEELQLEFLRLKFENEELEALKSELEWRKKSERKEMEALRDEMATMQTLYQYRTYSVDSSESSSDENNSDKDTREEVEELSKVLGDLVRENRELEETRQELCQKIQEDRAACIQLRVEIKIEQEKIERRRLSAS